MKEWKYRFRRGLASLLTVGMIASGVNVTACLPAYAAKAATTAPKYTDAELKAAVKEVTDGLKKEISELVHGDSAADGTEKAEFNIGIDCENEELRKAVEGKKSEIVAAVLRDCSADLFWYDQASKVLENGSYGLKVQFSDTKADFIFRFAVKDSYKWPYSLSVPDSVWVWQIRETKKALEDPKLQSGEIRKALYDGLKNAIVKLVNGEAPAQQTSAFTVLFHDIDTEAKAKVLKEEAEKMIPEIMESLSKDCPSELFWYDQSFKEFDKGSYKYDFNSDNVTTQYKSAHFVFTLAVKESYRGLNTPDNPESIWADGISDSKTGIDSILDQYNQTKGMSDYEILCGFRDELCKYSAEGKLTEAFQYFCDRTFGAPEKGTRCCTVEGTVNGTPGTWNIVRIDGKNYLVDMGKHVSGKNGEFFLVGAQRQQDGSYVIGNGTRYIPGKADLGTKPVPTSPVKYRPEQTGFHFVSQPAGKAGDTLVVKVEGNIGETVNFVSSNPTAATIERKAELGNNAALIHLNDIGATEAVSVVIQAIAEETDAYVRTTIKYTMVIQPKDTGNTNQPPVNNPGGGNGGGGSNTGGSAGGSTGGGGSIGSLSVSSSAGPELLPQVDFCIESGTDKIVKAVGAPDFTITAWGQVNDSKVTYASSDPAVATVDAATGTVNIVGAGTATISATASATTLHREEKCEYTVEVQ